MNHASNFVESEGYTGPERRRRTHLTEEQIDEIATRAADKAVAKTVSKLTSAAYEEIGKSVVHKLFYLIGAIAVAGYVWLKAGGFIKG